MEASLPSANSCLSTVGDTSNADAVRSQLSPSSAPQSTRQASDRKGCREAVAEFHVLRARNG